MPDPLFDRLFTETDHLTWASAGEVRHLARRRVRRTRIAVLTTAAVVLGVIAGGVAFARTGERPPPQPATTPTVEPTTPPPTGKPTQYPPTQFPPPPQPAAEGPATIDSLFLRPGDVGPGYRAADVDERLGDGDSGIDFEVSLIGCRRQVWRPATLVERRRSILRGDRLFLYQTVGRYRTGDAARFMDRLRGVVHDCKPGREYSIEIVAERFAGQDALLVRVTGVSWESTTVFVRQGDLLTEFSAPPDPLGPAAARELARKAARRLCGDATTC